MLVRATPALVAVVLLWCSSLPAESARAATSIVDSAAGEIKSNHFSRAKALLQHALEIDPNSAEANNLLGICQARTGETEKARRSFERAIELDPKLAAAYVNLGNLLLSSRKETDAFKVFRAALSIDPAILANDPHSYFNFNTWGLCLMDARKYPEAVQAFQRSILINPKFLAARVNLGQALIRMDREDAALSEFLAVIRWDPKDYQTRYNVGLIYARQDKFKLAAKYLRQAHETSHGDKAIAFALMGAELKLGNRSEAESLLAGLDGWNPPDTAARKAIALLWLESGNPAAGAQTVRGDESASRDYYDAARREAEDSLEKARYTESAEILEAARDLEPADAAFHDLLGSVYYALGKPQKAFDEFNAAVKIKPADPDYHYKLGMVFLKNHTPDPAINVFENATKIRPDVPKLWLGLGMSYYLASRLPQAERALREALALDPNYQQAYVVLGDLLYQSDRADDAIALLRQAIDLHPDWYFPYYYYGLVALRRGGANTSDILQALRKAIALNPQFAEAHCELGKALARAGQPQEAIQELDRSLALKPSLTEPHYQLGVIYRQMGDSRSASEQFALFSAAKQKNNPVDQVRAQLESFEAEKQKDQTAPKPKP